MVSVRTYTLLINVFVFYAVLSTLLGTVIALPIFILAVGSLFYFHIEPVDRDVADEVLLPNTKVEVIAHRGGSLDAPENTLEAFRLASKNGATGIELDVEFTKDGIPIIMHDGTVDRTTDGTGEVSSFTLAELKKLNAAGNFKHSGKFSHVKVPTLEEGISVCLSLGMKMFLDCKGFNSSKTADAIVNIFQKYPEMYQNAAVCSFNPRIILKVRRRDSGIVTGLTHRRHVIRTKTADSDEPRHAAKWKQYLSWPLDLLLEWSQNTWLWYLCGNSVFLAHIDQVSMNYVRAWRALGVRVLVWTVNQPAQKEMCARILECPYLTDTLTDATTKQHIKMQ